RFPGGEDDSSRGIGMFLLPRRLSDGSLNEYTIDRLKDKLGTRSVPSGEITLHGAHAIQVGQLENGFRQRFRSCIPNARPLAIGRSESTGPVEDPRGPVRDDVTC